MFAPKSLRLCLTLTPLVLLLAACGGGNGSSTTTGGTTTGGLTTDGDIDSGLSHVAVEMPRGETSQQSGAFFSTIGRDQAAALSASLAMVFEVVENHGDDSGENCKQLGAEFASCSVINLHLKDTAARLDGTDWKIYFHSIRRILRADSADFRVFHVNGDLHYLAPVESYTGFGNDTVKTIKLITEFSHLHETDMLPNYWLVRGSEVSLLSNSTSTDDIADYGVAITGSNATAYNGEPIAVANSSNRFDKYRATTPSVSVADVIIPTPKLSNPGTGELALGSGLSFDANVLSVASRSALAARLKRFYSPSGSLTSVTTAIDTALPTDQYQLTVDSTGIAITGGGSEAVFHGAQSLLSLITPGITSIPFIDVTDAPRFDYRGMHVDLARNFQSVETLRRLIEQMSAYKLNTLHLHLSDDEGWRLQIPSLPELTSIGANRRFQIDSAGNVSETGGLMPQLGSGPDNNTSASGFLSRSQFIDLLRYARDRYVSVIPAFDMPGHARAAVVAMRVRAARSGNTTDNTIRLDDPADDSRYLTVQHYRDGLMNPCIEGTYNFIQSIVTDVKAMYDEAEIPLTTWHMGGDEANSIFKGAGFQDQNDANPIPWKGDIDSSLYDFPWEKSPACQALINSDPSLDSLSDLTPYFVARLATIVSNAGIPKLYAYQDIMRNVDASSLATAKVGINFWESITGSGYNTAYDWPNRGFETIIAAPDFLYFDHPQEVDPKERGYYWATRWTDTQKVFSFMPENLPQNAETTVTREGNSYTASASAAFSGFTGIQGHIWGETVRTAEQFDSMVFPRLLALAERAWHKGAWEIDYAPGAQFSSSSARTDLSSLQNDWSRFATALGEKELIKLDAAGVAYRVPTVGVSSADGVIEMNTEFPGLAIEYSTSSDTFEARPFDASAPPTAVSTVRARSANGARAGRITTVE